jgi:hypothetical protein
VIHLLNVFFLCSLCLNSPPRNVSFAITACFNTPIPPTTTPTTIGTSTQKTTATLPPTTTTANYCTQENGMDTPWPIKPNQITSNPLPVQTTPPGDINPTPNTPGLAYPLPTPQINVTVDQPATLTLIYIPTDRPNQPTNVEEFQVVFVYLNGTISPPFTSQIPSAGKTTPPGETTTTPSTTTAVLPTDDSPQIKLPHEFELPNGTIIIITITSTTNNSNPTGVSYYSLLY